MKIILVKKHIRYTLKNLRKMFEAIHDEKKEL